jgi:hypothetical protein
LSEPSSPSHARTELLAAVGAELHQVVPGWRWIAQELLAQDSRIDLFGVDEDAAAVIVGVGAAPRELELLGRLLAWRHWLTPRLPDWLKLAPALGVRPDRPIRAVLVCHEPGIELCTAVESLGLSWLQLVRRRGDEGGRRAPGARLERLVARPEDTGLPRSGNGAVQRAPVVESAPQAAFRTGLTDADLGLSPDERAEFEPVE